MPIPPSLNVVLTSVLLVVLVLIAAATAFIVDRQDLLAFKRSYRRRLRALAPLLAALVLVLAVNSLARDVVPELSWIVGVNVTGYIHGLERDLVATIQSFQAPWLTTYFSFTYIYGYVFLLVFPFVAYGVLEDRAPFRVLVVAYIVNYVVGLVCYTLFIAYGPRNLMPEQVEPLLYATYPEFKLLTTKINSNTNAFPSLHTALSTTVMLIAWRTRRTYPRWFALAAVLAVSVMTSTMYLGIHWFTDVVAGVPLAVLSVAVARRYAARKSETDTGSPRRDTGERVT